MSERERPPAYFSGHKEFDQVCDLSHLVEVGYRELQVSSEATKGNSLLRKFKATTTSGAADFGSNLTVLQMRQLLSQERMAPELLPYQS